ncbi:sulfurtransferase TusA family protein [Salipiger bermudensis]|uniref:sulfurtransferase TusA family protein n=1 Tax=Salipiger bermudensis TaxID=344736 RepID=UPI00300A1CCA
MDSGTGAAYLRTMDWDHELDARGLLCPLPVLKARKRLQGMQSGQVLRIVATDPAAVIDVPHFCTEAGHAFLGASELQDAQVYLIRKA